MIALSLPRVLAGIALLMGSGVAGEILAPPAEPPPAGAPPLATRAQVPPAATEIDPAGAASTALARPLFSPGRRVDIVALDAAPVLGAPVPPRLSGTILTQRGNYAVFEPGGSKQPVVAVLGGAVDGWTVQAITNGSAVVVRAGAIRVLKAAFSPEGTPVQTTQPVGLLATKRLDPHLAP